MPVHIQALYVGISTLVLISAVVSLSLVALKLALFNVLESVWMILSFY